MKHLPPSGRPPESVRKLVDRRVARTRRSIDGAFLKLLRDRGYESIGVSDIVREADVGRATFYEHYTSKDDLLRAQLRHVSASMLRVLPGKTELIDATALFCHVRDVPMLYRLVAGRSAGARSLRILQGVLEERTSEILSAHLADGAGLRKPLTSVLAARLLVANLCALLAWWTEHGMAATVDEMQCLLRMSISPILERADAV